MRVLNLDGGGVRGFFEIAILREIELLLKSRKNRDHDKFIPGLEATEIADLFDVITATSTGSLIASSLLLEPSAVRTKKASPDPWNTRRLYSAFPEIVEGIFKCSLKHRAQTLNGLLGPKYEHHGLYNSAFKMFGKAKLNNLRTDTCDLFILTYDLNTRTQIQFSSCDSSTQDHFLADIVAASCSMPIYFPAVEIVDSRRNIPFLLVDGNVSNSNPSTIAYKNGKAKIKRFEKSCTTAAQSKGAASPQPLQCWSPHSWSTLL